MARTIALLTLAALFAAGCGKPPTIAPSPEIMVTSSPAAPTHVIILRGRIQD